MESTFETDSPSRDKVLVAIDNPEFWCFGYFLGIFVSKTTVFALVIDPWFDIAHYPRGDLWQGLGHRPRIL